MKKFYFIALVCVVLVMLSACTKGNNGTQPPKITPPEPTKTPTQNVIPSEPGKTPPQDPSTGNDAKEPMKVQLTQDQVKGMFGDRYVEVIDAVSGEWKVWRYDVMPINGYKFEETESKIDVEGLKSQKVKGQVFVTWRPDGKLMSIVYYGMNDGKVKAYYINGFAGEDVG